MAYGNPMSQMADAAKLSIPQLQQALRDGTIDPQVGQLVLNSKIIADKKAKAAMQAQQPVQPPVVAQNAAYGQGVATLPSNLPAQTMAGGGIIAFAGPEGSLVPGTNMTQAQIDEADAQYKAAMENSFLPPAQELVNRTLKYATNPVTAAARYGIDKISGLQWVPDPATGKLVHKSELQSALPTASPVTTNASKSYFNTAQPEAKDTSVKADDAYINSLNPANNTTPAVADLSYRNPSNTDTRDTSAPASRPAAGTGIGYIPTGYDTKFIDELRKGDKNPATGEYYTRAELAAQRKQEFIDAGGDPEAYTKEKAAAEEAGTKSEGKRKADEAAPWFEAADRLSKAKPNQGLLGLLGEGTIGYGTKAGEITDKDELRAEAMRKELGQIALAQNQYSQSVATGDRDAMEKARTRIDDSTKLLGTMGMKSTDVANEAKRFSIEQANKMQVAQMQSGDVRYAADKAGREIASMADDIQAAAAKAGHPIDRATATKQAYENKNPSVYGANLRNEASQRRDWTNELNKLVASGMTNDAAAKARIVELRANLSALGPDGGTAAPVANPYAGFSPISRG